jgi:hypothetical protein
VYIFQALLADLSAICSLLPSEGDPNFSRCFPYNELVRVQHINLAEFLHRKGTVVLGDDLTGTEVAEQIMKMLK